MTQEQLRRSFYFQYFPDLQLRLVDKEVVAAAVGEWCKSLTNVADTLGLPPHEISPLYNVLDDIAAKQMLLECHKIEILKVFLPHAEKLSF